MKDKIIYHAEKTAEEFKKEFRTQIVVAVTAAFAFLIALSWRTPIEKIIQNVKDSLGISQGNIYVEFFSAALVTFLAVGVLIFLTRWNSNQDAKMRERLSGQKRLFV